MKKWLGKNKETVFFLLFVFFVWRLLIQVFLWIGQLVLPLKKLFLGGGDKFFLNPGFWAWANFDGEHYLAIAHHGYGNFEQAFFPFYPWLIKTLVFPYKENLFSLLLSGLAISHFAFFIVLILFYFLVRLDFPQEKAYWSILFLLTFPTSFFFGAVYTESLFLTLILGCFYAARRGKWWLAGILGAFASATRIVGIFLLPAIFWEWLEQNKSKIQNPKPKLLISLLPIFLIPLGLFSYMRYLAVHYQDLLMFIHVQPAYGAQRVVDKIILLYQVFWRYFKMIATTKIDPLYFTVWLEFLTGAVFLALLVFSFLRKIRLSYLIFAVLVYITPTLTGTFSSMPRYVLVLFPCFIALALIKNRLFRTLLLVVCFLLLGVATIFFTRGYWVG